jgi:hypothetical protein
MTIAIRDFAEIEHRTQTNSLTVVARARAGRARSIFLVIS